MHRLPTYGLIVCLAACSGGGGSEPAAPPGPSNASPSANAGADIIAGEADVIELDGSQSSDSDGSISSYRWRQVSGPRASFRVDDAATAQIQVPLVASATELILELRVIDDDGASATDRARVEVLPAPQPSRLAFSFEFEGRARTYTVYTPGAYAAGAPSVLLLHGGGSNMNTVLGRNTSAGRWVDLAAREGFLLIAPNGFNPRTQSGLGDRQTWNDLRDDTRLSQENDAGFLLDVLSQLERGRGIDRAQIYITGASNGGIMSQTMLVLYPAEFAGAAAFVSSLPEEAIPEAQNPPPVFLSHGAEDPLVPFDGGEVGDGGAPVRPVPETIAYWIERTNAVAAPVSSRDLPDTAPDDNCIITETVYETSNGEPAVTVYEARGGGHFIPDPTPRNAPPGVDFGVQCRDVHGVDLALEFFQALWQ